MTTTTNRLWLAEEAKRRQTRARDEAKQIAIDYAYRAHGVVLGTTLHNCFAEYLDNKFLYSQYSEQYSQFPAIVEVYNRRLADNLEIIASSKDTYFPD